MTKPIENITSGRGVQSQTPLPQDLPEHLLEVKKVLLRVGITGNIPRELIEFLHTRLSGKRLTNSSSQEVKSILEKHGIKGRALKNTGQLAQLLGNIQERKAEINRSTKLDSSQPVTIRRTTPFPQLKVTVEVLEIKKPCTNPVEEAALKFQTLDRSKFEQSIQAVEWFTQEYCSSIGPIAERLLNEELVEGKEILEWAKRIIPQIEINDFIKPDTKITIGHTQAITELVFQEIIFPQNALIVQSIEGLAIGIIPDEPSIKKSYKGADVPCYTVYPLSGELTYAFCFPKCIIYPISRDIDLYQNQVPNVQKNWQNYRLDKLPRESFLENPNLIGAWSGILFYNHVSDFIVGMRGDTLAEELEHYDSNKTAEKRAGRRFHGHIEGEFTELVRAQLKPDSALLIELNSKTPGPEQDEFALGIFELRAKAGAMRFSPFPPHTLLEAIASEIINTSGFQEEPGEYAICRNLAAKYLSPHLLNKSAESTNREGWLRLFDDNLRSRTNDQEEDKRLIAEFNRKLFIGSNSFLDQHFYH